MLAFAAHLTEPRLVGIGRFKHQLPPPVCDLQGILGHPAHHGEPNVVQAIAVRGERRGGVEDRAAHTHLALGRVGTAKFIHHRLGDCEGAAVAVDVLPLASFQAASIPKAVVAVNVLVAQVFHPNQRIQDVYLVGGDIDRRHRDGQDFHVLGRLQFQGSLAETPGFHFQRDRVAPWRRIGMAGAYGTR